MKRPLDFRLRLPGTLLLAAVIIPLDGRIGCAADEIDRLRARLAQLDSQVIPAADRDSQRTMVSRAVRAGIAQANAASTAEWNGIASRNDWERLRRQKLDRLARSLSRRPFEPGSPTVLVTGRIPGEGFRIENLVIQPAGRTFITANMYLPEPSRDLMPGILLAHSHHNPKQEGELQDMGMTWARAGCCVLVPDQLGHGERRQHPFQSAADYPREFAVGRQDYYFRYDMSLQLYLVGESLMGWMVHDLMSCIDVLAARPGVDSQRLILLGSVAGGGDPAAVTAALDERIDCVVPFNFGGPQPESRYPLPPDADTTFNFAGSGSWESTRNLRLSAAEDSLFLPWVIVGSVAPRHLIHAHEFAWDQDRDPVWRRYQRIWNLYGPDAGSRLAFTHGHGTLTGKDPPGSHCNNIGAVHRRQIHVAFRNWFGIEVRPEDEYQNRRPREELVCLTDAARQQLRPQPLYRILAAMADEQLAAARTTREQVSPEERRKRLRESCIRLLGNVEPTQPIQVQNGSGQVERFGELAVKREILETERGIRVPVITLWRQADSDSAPPRNSIFLVAAGGIARMLEQQREFIADRLCREFSVVLVEIRGTGESSPGSERGQQGAITAHSATHWMLGRSILGGQLRDFRAAWRHFRRGNPHARAEVAALAEFTPLDSGAAFAHPRRISGRPPECDAAPALLAVLLALFEDDVERICCHGGLVSFRSALESPFVQIPHECLVPGLLCELDLPDLVAALAPRQVELDTLVDGRGRSVPQDEVEAEYAVASRVFADHNARSHLQFHESHNR
jgi:dienelactone hydrolase